MLFVLDREWNDEFLNRPTHLARCLVNTLPGGLTVFYNYIPTLIRSSETSSYLHPTLNPNSLTAASLPEHQSHVDETHCRTTLFPNILP